MLRLQVRIQLVVFAVVSLATLVYGATQLLDLGSVVRPPALVRAEFASAGGVYPRADVDLLGVRVGRVREILPGPGTGSTVVMEIDDGADVPGDVHATVSSKSAIGEQYVLLTPSSGSGGGRLEDGDTIPLARTTSPPDLSRLLSSLDALAGSVPLDDLAVALDSGSRAVRGLGPTVGRLLDDSNALARSGVDNVEALTDLIEDASTVLDTQVELGSRTQSSLRDLAALTTTLRRLDPTFEQVFTRGIAAGTEVTGLLTDTQKALPVLLNNLVVLTTIGTDRIPELRKALVMFPWALDQGQSSVRYCDEYDPSTGKPIESTCHYDEQGRPIWSAHLAQQLPETQTDPPYHPCTRGYEGTRRYGPNGRPLRGEGPAQPRDAEPNPMAQCTAPPTDPHTPNVRGTQNVIGTAVARGRTGPGRGSALFNPESGLLATSDGSLLRIEGGSAPRPPAGAAGLGWLLTRPMAG